jgi:hypothetical protein
MQSDLPEDELDEGDDDESLDGPEYRPPEWAFAISFFWPGAGLLYLRKPWLGLLNFAAVVAIAAAVWMALPVGKREKAAPWIGMLLCGASGVWAYSVATEINQRRAEEFESGHNVSPEDSEERR